MHCFRNRSIGARISLLTAASILLVIGTIGAFYAISQNIALHAGGTTKTIYLNAEKKRIRDSIIIMSTSIANRIRDVKNEEDMKAAMVGTLKANAEAIKAKEAEARHRAEEAVAAMRDAEAARKTAENAKTEGMHAAADQLDGILQILEDASDQLGRNISRSEEGAATQAQRITETSASIQEMNSTIRDIAQNADIASETVNTARSRADEGVASLGKAMLGLNAVREQSLASQQDMSALGSQTEAITQIMSMISDIADQTNLLALNAAIEAARAGEAGRGFAVVADEVRKLTEKTMTSTNEVGNAVHGIQQTSRRSIENVDLTVNRIQEAATLAGQSESVLQEIMSLVDSASMQVKSIAVASEQQSATTEEINRTVEGVDAIADETVSSMTHGAQAVSAMHAQVEQLRSLVNALKNA